MRIAKLVMAASLALVSACSGTPSVKDAEKKVATFHQNLDKGDIEAVWRDSSEQITKTETKENLTQLLTAIHTRFGNVKDTKQSGWKVNVNNGVSTTEVTMETNFDKGKLEEHFVFLSTADGMKLAGYQFNQK